MGFILGALVGAVMALLYAPQRGELTRDELRQRSDELRRRADDLQRAAQKLADEAQARGRELVGDAKRQWERTTSGPTTSAGPGSTGSTGPTGPSSTT
jgi:gas vesicle protein